MTDSQGVWCKDDDRPVTDEAEIELLVRAFYTRIRADAVLGPIFDGVIGITGSRIS